MGCGNSTATSTGGGESLFSCVCVCVREREEERGRIIAARYVKILTAFIRQLLTDINCTLANIWETQTVHVNQ